MKTLVNYILTNAKTTDSWNEKFYQKSDNIVEIYLDNVKHDVTDLFNKCLSSDGMFHRSEFDEIFEPINNELIELELDLEMNDISETEFSQKKVNLLNS